MEFATLIHEPWWSLLQILLVGAGASLLLKVDARALGLRAVAVAWVLGSLLVGATVLACGFAESLIAARWIVGFGALGLLAPVILAIRRNKGIPALDPFLLLVAVAVGTWLVLRQVAWFDMPFEGDEQTIWTSKASAIFDAGGFNDTYRGYLGRAVHHPDYPPLNPLLQLWMRIGQGAEFEGWLRWPTYGFDLAALLYLAGAVRARVEEPVAALLVAGAFAATCIGVQPAEADGMVRLGLLMAVDGAVALLSGRHGIAKMTIPLGLALLVASKHEGSALAVVIALAIVLTRLVARPPLATPGIQRRVVKAFLLPAALVAGIWAWNNALGIGSDLFNPGERRGLFANLIAVGGDRMGTLLHWFTRDFLLAARASSFGLFLAIASTALVCRSAQRADIVMPALTALGGTLLYLLVFLGTPHDLSWHWGTAGPRVLGHLNFVAVLWAATALGVRIEAQRAARAADERGRARSDSSPR